MDNVFPSYEEMLTDLFAVQAMSILLASAVDRMVKADQFPSEDVANAMFDQAYDGAWEAARNMMARRGAKP